MATTARQSDNQAARGRTVPTRAAPAGRKVRRIARTLAQSTLLAAGIAVSQFNPPEIDSRFHLFNPKLVDRLQAPITRYHE
jgi:hypothetical protein